MFVPEWCVITTQDGTLSGAETLNGHHGWVLMRLLDILLRLWVFTEINNVTLIKLL